MNSNSYSIGEETDGGMMKPIESKQIMKPGPKQQENGAKESLSDDNSRQLPLEQNNLLHLPSVGNSNGNSSSNSSVGRVNTSNRNGAGMKMNMSGLGGLNNSGNEKYLIDTLRREINEHGSPTSLIDSPIFKDTKKQLTLASTSDSSITNFKDFQHSLSTSNLSNLLKRPGNERSVSSSSLKGGKSPNRRNKNTISDKNPTNINNIGNNTGSSVNGDTTLSNSKITINDHKTLVDQFYSINERNPIKQDELGEIKYVPIDSSIKSDHELTNYLLNIDTIMKDLYQQDDNNTLIPFIKTIESINESLNKPDLSFENKSFADLNQLIEQLNHLQQSIGQLNQLIMANSEKVKTKYKGEINKNVNKLNDLLLTLENLEHRLNKTKTIINESKKTISTDILNIIEVLEEVDYRFIEYSRETRKTRFKQLTIALSVLVLIISTYISIYGV